MLNRLMPGHSDASNESKLGGLIRPEAKQMSLPAALNALRAGTIEYPYDDGELSGLVSGVSAIPITRPPKKGADLSPEFEAQRQQNEADRLEMRQALLAKRYGGGISPAAMARLDKAEQQLLEMK
jgi:hypothetical protein